MNRNNQIVMQRETVKGTIQNKAFISLLKTLSYVITGRLHFKQERIGELITTDDGQEYKVFRHVIVDPKYDHQKNHKLFYESVLTLPMVPRIKTNDYH